MDQRQQKSPFFRPSSSQPTHRIVIVQQRTPGGKHKRTIQKQESIESEKKSTVLGTASNLVNAIVGAGIVGIPFAVRQCGFVSGIVLIIVCAFVTEKSLRLLINTAKHIHVPTYETLAEACFGSIGFRFVALNMFFTAFGAMISYLMIVKQTFGTLLLGTEDDILANRAIALDTTYMRRAILLIISITIMLPIACKRDMADLAQTSRFNVIVDTLLVGLVAFTSPIWYNKNSEGVDDSSIASDRSGMATVETDWFFRGDTIFVGLGVLSFAYVCQHSAFIIAGSLERPTSKRWSNVTTTALILCGILNLICGILGYLGYREETQGNILENLGRNNLPANIARAMLGMTMLFVYPVESFVTRHVCVVLLFSGRSAHEGNDAHILSRADRRIGLTTALYILAVIPAVLTNDLGPVLAITGTVGGSCLSYLGPGVIYLGVHGERFLSLARQAFGRRNEASEEHSVTQSNENSADETTPLVVGGDATNIITSENQDAVEVVGVWNHILWYLIGMPLWCAIARSGKVQLQEHITEMTMKSPHPIRIGDVEYKRVAIPLNRDDNEDEESFLGDHLNKMVRDQSMPHLSNLITTSGSAGTLMNINQQIGQGLLEQQKKISVKRSTEEIVEADPQELPPSWHDFYVAIFLIILGFIALFAGMYSIFM